MLRIGAILILLIASFGFSESNMRAKIEDIHQFVETQKQTKSPPNVIFLTEMDNGVLAGGANSRADWMIKNAGGINLLKKEGDLALSNDEIIALNPDVILISNQNAYSDVAMMMKLFQELPASGQTKASKNNRIYMIDYRLLTGDETPLLIFEVEKLAQLFYLNQS